VRSPGSPRRVPPTVAKARDEERKQDVVSFVRAIGLVQIAVRSAVTVRGAARTLSKAA